MDKLQDFLNRVLGWLIHGNMRTVGWDGTNMHIMSDQTL